LVSENVVDFDPGPLVRTLNIYSVEDEVRNEYRKDPVPRKLSYKQLVTGMVGFKVEVHGVLSGIVGGHYKLRTGEQDLDSLDQMVLVRQRYDSSKGVQPWVLTFGRLEV
jgi:hypothetical protein